MDKRLIDGEAERRCDLFEVLDYIFGNAHTDDRHLTIFFEPLLRSFTRRLRKLSVPAFQPATRMYIIYTLSSSAHNPRRRHLRYSFRLSRRAFHLLPALAD